MKFVFHLKNSIISYYVKREEDSSPSQIWIFYLSSDHHCFIRSEHPSLSFFLIIPDQYLSVFPFTQKIARCRCFTEICTYQDFCIAFFSYIGKHLRILFHQKCKLSVYKHGMFFSQPDQLLIIVEYRIGIG